MRVSILGSRAYNRWTMAAPLFDRAAREMAARFGPQRRADRRPGNINWWARASTQPPVRWSGSQTGLVTQLLRCRARHPCSAGNTAPPHPLVSQADFISTGRSEAGVHHPKARGPDHQPMLLRLPSVKPADSACAASAPRPRWRCATRPV